MLQTSCKNVLFYEKAPGCNLATCAKKKKATQTSGFLMLQKVILSLLDDKLDGREGLAIAHDRAEIDAVIEVSN